MTLRVIHKQTVGVGTIVELALDENLLVGRNGLVASTDGGTAVRGDFGNHVVRVEGTVAADGDASGIWLGSYNTASSYNEVVIAVTGYITGGDAISMSSSQSSVTNFGLIEASSFGIWFGGIGAEVSRMENAGIISAGYGVVSAGNESLHILNTGTIFGEYYSVWAGASADTLRNLGQLFGLVDLGAGDDLYDGRGGTSEGGILGGAGNDVFRPGDGIDIINGGDGIDMLDFRTGGPVRVVLDGTAEHSGAAMDDIYSAIENVQGSRFGNDDLRGDGAANTFFGLGGNDKLSGGLGNDSLVGGVGRDKLTGGEGDDRFVFNFVNEGGDSISDFGNITRNNDAFAIYAAGFGGGLVAGALDPKFFQSRADHVAQDADDRFLFDTATSELWFDVNGNLAGGQTLIASVQSGVSLSALDILLT